MPGYTRMTTRMAGHTQLDGFTPVEAVRSKTPPAKGEKGEPPSRRQLRRKLAALERKKKET